MKEQVSSESATPAPSPAAVDAQFDSGVPAILTSADSTAADAVQQLGQVQQARLSRLSRAANVAVAQYGANSSQAVAAQASVTATKTAVSRIAVVSQQATTPAPAVAANGWALQGRVYDSNLNPMTAYSVFLVDGQKNYLSTYGFTYTDSTGYFLLKYAPSSQPAGAPSPRLFLEVADTNASPVYLSTAAFVPVPGKATYQTVTLAAGNSALGDPPEEVRAVALPPVKKKWKPLKK
jgi:hypothetical protein